MTPIIIRIAVLTCIIGYGVFALTAHDMATCEAHHSTITCLHSLTP